MESAPGKGKVFRDVGGHPCHVTGTCADISGRKLAEKALSELNQTLETRVVAKVAERSRVEDTLHQAQKMEAGRPFRRSGEEPHRGTLPVLGQRRLPKKASPYLFIDGNAPVATTAITCFGPAATLQLPGDQAVHEAVF